MKHALVSGASGFIGAHVVRELLARDLQVRALVLPGDRAPNLDGLAIERASGDVCDPASLAAAMRGVDHVFHVAAVYQLWTGDRTLMHRVNVDGTRNVLLAARTAGVQRVIHTSSIARFGGQGLGRQATEQSPHELAVAAARAGQDVVIVAPTGPIGPGELARHRRAVCCSPARRCPS